MARPPQHGLERARWHFNKIQRLFQERPDLREKHERDLAIMTARNAVDPAGPNYWETGRDIGIYDRFFSEGLAPMRLGANLEEALLAIPTSRKSMLIHEYGPGQGNALSQIASSLNQHGRRVESVAIDACPHPMLLEKQQRGEINQIVHVGGEHFMPEREPHAIFDVMGALTYVTPELRADHFLKTVHSLAPGGLMLVGFDQSYTLPATVSPVDAREITGGLFGRSYRDLPGVYDHMKSYKQRGAIERYLAKSGFRAKFFESTRYDRYLPTWGLIVHKPLSEK